MAEAKNGLATEIEKFVANTMEYIKERYPLLIDGIGAPALRTDSMAGTPWSSSGATATARTWPRCGPISANASRSWWGSTAAPTR